METRPESSTAEVKPDITILVVDDDPDVLFATCRLLSRAGFGVIQAPTGGQGLALARQDLPDLVLLDAVLPDIDGTEVCRSLKKDPETRKIPVILISSLKISSRDQTDGLELGADEYIARPIGNRELLARVRAFIRLKATEKQLMQREEALNTMVAELEQYRNQLEKRVRKRTAALELEVAERWRVESLLRRRERMAVMRSRIADAFLTSPSQTLFPRVLDILLEFFDSPQGYLGYIDEKGSLVCPAIRLGQGSAGEAVPAITLPREKWQEFPGLGSSPDRSVLLEIPGLFLDGRTRFNILLAAPLTGDNTLVGHMGVGNSAGGYTEDDRQQMIKVCEFLSPILSMFIRQERARTDLQVHARKLAEKNIALNVLLENRDEDKKNMTSTIIRNFERLVFPYHEKMRQSDSLEEILTYLKIVEKNTLESMEPLGKSVSDKYRLFTPMEIRVADLIKAGKTSKEMSTLLNISPRAVFFHRGNIRKKLDLQGRKINLRTYLLSL